LWPGEERPSSPTPSFLLLSLDVCDAVVVVAIPPPPRATAMRGDDDGRLRTDRSSRYDDGGLSPTNAARDGDDDGDDDDDDDDGRARPAAIAAVIVVERIGGNASAAARGWVRRSIIEGCRRIVASVADPAILVRDDDMTSQRWMDARLVVEEVKWEKRENEEMTDEGQYSLSLVSILFGAKHHGTTIDGTRMLDIARRIALPYAKK